MHYLERDELAGLKRLQREQSTKSAYVFVNERGQPFGRMGIGRMIERAGKDAKLPSRCMSTCCATAQATPWLAGAWIRGGAALPGPRLDPNTVRYTAMSPEPKDIWR